MPGWMDHFCRWCSLQTWPTAPEEHLPTEKFQVPPGSELRVEVGQAKCYITITSGNAEVFGAVLQSHRRIELQHTKIAIFTYEGCSSVLEGFPAEPGCVPLLRLRVLEAAFSATLECVSCNGAAGACTTHTSASRPSTHHSFADCILGSLHSRLCTPCRAHVCRYVSDETPMHAYLNAAFIVNNQRKLARDKRPGPVVAVVGPHDCGKTSLTTILLNYAIRSGWNPLLVETDVRHGMITVPGALSAVQVRPQLLFCLVTPGHCVSHS